MIDAGDRTTGTRFLVRTQLSNPAPFTRSWGAQVSPSLTDEAKLVVVPETVSDERAILAKVSDIALHGVKRAKLAAGESVVVGLKIIGNLVVQHCVARGAMVIAVDTAEYRLARTHGRRQAPPADHPGDGVFVSVYLLPVGYFPGAGLMSFCGP